MADSPFVAEVIQHAKDGELFVDASGRKYRVSIGPLGRDLSVWSDQLSERQGWISHWTARLVVIPGLRSLQTLERPATRTKRR